MIRVHLPYHLQVLAGASEEVTLTVPAPATLAAVLDALESAYPPLRGTLRDPRSGARRPMVRFYACREDLSHAPPGTILPDPVAAGREPLLIVGAVAGG
ncbi:MAG: MoaD/ThiS family protein [Bryobacteraceae bacterium]|nr:MoaD/ThiS family protein [Bryobacteraceae bacterium]MCX7604787.1 MoaD/ThiS family protein [Bryobacteraceae bacterium]